MNSTTIKMLEFDKITEILLDFAISEQGKEKIKRLEPALDINTIKHQLRETTEAKSIIMKSASVPLHHLNGIENIMGKLEREMILQPGELSKVYSLLKDGQKLKRFMREKESLGPLVSSYAYSMYELTELAEEIARAIRYDQVDDSATPRLVKIRKRIASTEDKIKLKLEGIMRSGVNTDYIQERIISVRNGRYVIPVKKSYKNSIDGQVLDISSTGSTVFVEPKAIGKLQDELNLLKSEEEDEVYQVLSSLTGLVFAAKKEISINIETMVHYDFIFAKAKYSKAIDGNEVKLNNEKYIDMKGAKHPLLGKNAVPNDLTIGKGYHTLVITGPNTGGKTVAIKTVGLLTLMIQAGLHIPVQRDSSMAIFQDVLVDIGDGQSIEQSLSTFSSHVKNLISILECANPSSLVLLDELGAGTDPSEGMGLAASILEHIHHQDAIMIATTHYNEIKELAKKYQGFENGSMGFDIDTLKPTYKLSIGISGESNAFLIALRLGMDKKMIERAHEITYRERKTYATYETKEATKLKNTEIITQHGKQLEKWKQISENKKRVEKSKPKENFKLGDAVYIRSLETNGIVCELENSKGEVGVLVKKTKLKINKKRLSLYIDGKELYPEGYDMDIVFESKENRKKKQVMKRRHDENVSIITE